MKHMILYYLRKCWYIGVLYICMGVFMKEVALAGAREPFITASIRTNMFCKIMANNIYIYIFVRVDPTVGTFCKCND